MLFVALAVGIGLVVALLAIELALRVYDPLPHPLADLRWFYSLDAQGRIQTTAGWTGSQYVENRRVPIHMNALGLRGAEVGTKVAGEMRVLMLGDSFVFGQGVDDDRTIPARLQELLRAGAPGPRITVGNAGISGTGPREWSHTLQRFRDPFAPDAVVAVMFVGNDVLDTLQEPLSVVSGWLLTSDFAKVARQSWRFRLRVASRLWDKIEFVTGGLNLFQLGQPSSIGPGLALGDALFLDRDPARDAELPFLTEVAARLDAQFAAFAEAARGLPTLVVLLPARSVVLQDYEKLLVANKLDPALHERGRGHARLRALLAARGLAVIDLADRLLAAPERAGWYLPTDGHLNDLGCEQVAAWLNPAVAALLR